MYEDKNVIMVEYSLKMPNGCLVDRRRSFESIKEAKHFCNVSHNSMSADGHQLSGMPVIGNVHFVMTVNS